jgi:hypothetical protein
VLSPQSKNDDAGVIPDAPVGAVPRFFSKNQRNTRGHRPRLQRMHSNMLFLIVEAGLHSCRKATPGSTRDARRAGT